MPAGKSEIEQIMADRMGRDIQAQVDKHNPNTADVTPPSQAPKVEGGEGGELASPSQRGWYVGEEYMAGIPIYFGDDRHFCTILRPIEEVDWKRAHLIAAAPELLNALAEIMRGLRHVGNYPDADKVWADKMYCKAGEATAKAEGRSL